MLADYNKNPFDTKAAKMTFDGVYEEWSKRKYPTVSESNVKCYTAAYKTWSSLYHKVFKDLKLADLQTVIDACGKNYPTLRKIKVLFNQLYAFAIKTFYKAWFEANPECDYLIHTENGKHFNTEIIMTTTSIHWWSNLGLTAHHIAADTHVFPC